MPMEPLIFLSISNLFYEIFPLCFSGCHMYICMRGILEMQHHMFLW